ncbi:hypothetical protein LDI01_08790 [Lentilactobacillus diolivorans]|uniref:Uncharacterized protein n=2 Tax=Lentilactobacillus diolivorans TaxID=179838 RepID=A0A0R1SGH0_9LACO|nr:hypothetical protein FC85_GL002874 [Lentilactobacillus diolivorans DSM 14421]GEP23286.1 hypothetical protein LDI01_08790 [Lentilactobacillus diolivorans]
MTHSFSLPLSLPYTAAYYSDGILVYRPSRLDDNPWTNGDYASINFKSARESDLNLDKENRAGREL